MSRVDEVGQVGEQHGSDSCSQDIEFSNCSNDLLFEIWHKLAALAAIGTERVDSNSEVRLAAIDRTELCGLHFTEFTREATRGRLGIGTVACVAHFAAVCQSNAFPSIQTSMRPTWALIQLVLTL